jgi:hypothetical protein
VTAKKTIRNRPEEVLRIKPFTKTDRNSKNLTNEDAQRNVKMKNLEEGGDRPMGYFLSESHHGIL